MSLTGDSNRCPFTQTFPPTRESPLIISRGSWGSGIQMGTVGTVCLCFSSPGASARQQKAGGGGCCWLGPGGAWGAVFGQRCTWPLCYLGFLTTWRTEPRVSPRGRAKQKPSCLFQPRLGSHTATLWPHASWDLHRSARVLCPGREQAPSSHTVRRAGGKGVTLFGKCHLP